MNGLLNPFAFASGAVIPHDPFMFFDANTVAGADGSHPAAFSDSQGNVAIALLNTQVTLDVDAIDSQRAITFIPADSSGIFATVGGIALSDYTLVFVYNQLSHPANNRGILTFGPASGDAYNSDDAMVFESNGAADRISVFGGAGLAFSIADKVLQSGFNLISFVINGGNGELFINGVSVGTSSYGGFIACGSGALFMGMFILSSSPANFMHGQLAGVALWTSPLTTGPGSQLEDVENYFYGRYPSLP